MPRLSANLGFLWPDRPLLERIDAAAAAGFRAVELHWPYATPAAEVRERCARRGVALLGINTAVGSRPGDAGLAAVPGREAEAAALIDQAFGYAAEAGGTAVHVMAGKVPPEARAEGRRVLGEALKRVAERAEATGLDALLEPLNPRDMPGYFYCRVEEALEAIEAAGSARIRLMFDCYHVGVTQGDVLTRMRAAWPRIGHIQIAAVPSRAEPDEGELAYRAILGEVDALGWPGWVGCEYKPRGDTDAGLGWVAALGLAL